MAHTEMLNARFVIAITDFAFLTHPLLRILFPMSLSVCVQPAQLNSDWLLACLIGIAVLEKYPYRNLTCLYNKNGENQAHAVVDKNLAEPSILLLHDWYENWRK